MKQKIVIKVHMNCEKCRIKAMKIASSAEGVKTVAVEGSDMDQLVVVGDDVDSVELTSRLRKKVGFAKLVIVEEAKDKKPQQAKKKGKASGKQQEATPQQEKNEQENGKQKETTDPQKSKPSPCSQPCPPCPPYYCPPCPYPQYYMYDVPVDHSPLCMIM